MRSRLGGLFALAAVGVLPGGVPLCAADGALSAVHPDWTAVSPEFFPLAPADSIVQPVLRASDVTDAHASFVADPFLMHESDLWYLFFEAVTPLGVIAVATSPDALHWTYQRIVLTEPFQISFPSVFRVDGEYYMTPETTYKQAVRLYRSLDFPRGWTLVAELVKGRDFADPTIFRYHDLWWMFVGNGASDMCWLFYSTALDHGWVEHPASPIIAGNRARARPAGRGLVLQGDRLYRLAQNCTPTYGRGVRVFLVDELTTTTYHENLIPESPILDASGSGWNADGMHQCDPWWVGDHWVAAVDGQANGVWSIGIYTTPALAPTGVASTRTDGTGRVSGAPNPFQRATRISYDLAPAPHTARVRVVICDAAGRVVRSRDAGPGMTGTGSFLWDGRDAAGCLVPAGVYYCRVGAGPQAATTRLVIVR